MKYIIGLIFTVLGFFVVWKTGAIMSFTGRIAFAEKYLGTEGGTRIFLKIIGVIIIIISWMYMFNLGEGIIRFLFLPRAQ